MDFTEETATGAVEASFAATPDPRLRKVLQSLVKDFATIDDPAEAAAFGVDPPFRHAHFEVVLEPG